MNFTRRSWALVAGMGLAAAVASGPSGAWSWSSGERVEGNGDITAEARDLRGFDAVSMAGGFQVVVRQGAATKVEVKADRNLLPYLETRVVEGSNGRTLQIEPRKGVQFRTGTTPVITLEMPSLRAVAVAGSGSIRVESMKTGRVDAAIAGSGDIRFTQLEAERLAMKISGSGDIVASGRATTAAVTIAGSGDVKAAELRADEVKVNIAGSGDAQVHATQRLSVSIAGSGDVRYAGDPEINSSITGGGKVRRIGS
ncbi:head GIN domain-containing protein [Roseateles sp. BYS87W]|uniref:Head GIN domain-containing protein n=1 Tax=Pelomonas baiyunensis TaxID=3299026 RepID=A0ABW7H5P5_9BURK